MTRRQEILQLAAVEALSNSKALIEEAKILFDKGKWARSFALAVTASEEYVKAFEFKCEEAGFALPPVPKEGSHPFRQARFALLMITPHLMSIGGYNFFAQLTGVPQKKPNREFLELFIKTFNHDIRGKRNAALYVDLNETLSILSKQISKEEARDMIAFVDDASKEEPKFLRASGDQLQRALGMAFLPLSNLSQSKLFEQIGKLYLKKHDG